MPRSVTITGARAADKITEADLDQAFAGYLRPFADTGVHVYLGGAAGIDTLALHWLAEHTDVDLTIAVPSTVADQPAIAAEAIGHWRKRNRLVEVVELRAPEQGSIAYHARNRWMVDRSEFVIGFPLGNDPASGTWYTLDYAAAQGKPRLVVPL